MHGFFFVMLILRWLNGGGAQHAALRRLYASANFALQKSSGAPYGAPLFIDEFTIHLKPLIPKSIFREPNLQSFSYFLSFGQLLDSEKFFLSLSRSCLRPLIQILLFFLMSFFFVSDLRIYPIFFIKTNPLSYGTACSVSVNADFFTLIL